MIRVPIDHPASLDAFRHAVRGLIGGGVPPAEIAWDSGEGELFGATDEAGDGVGAAMASPPLSVPKGYFALAQDAICHRDAERHALLYELLWRLKHGEPKLLDDASDALVHRLAMMAKTVRRDMHKMTAFVRFRRVDDGESENGGADIGERYVAWFEPEHHILERIASFFVDRFAAMRWTILTPEGTLDWDRATLSLGPGVPRAQGPAGDDLEAWWRTYYASVFNPARANEKAMRAEMPKKYWKNLPEASLIPALLGEAETRARTMIASPPTAPRPANFWAPEPEDTPMTATTLDHPKTLAELKALAKACTRCHLHEHATQTVFGEGPADAPLVFVGEQPGDQEDLAGRPFVGPAGRLFDRALAEAGIDRDRVYVTNAVKHFKFEPRGKRRLHKTPAAPEIEACRWWVEQERAIIKPQLTVALGATAARSLAGRAVKITQERGSRLALRDGGEGFVTVHPSYLLRLREDADKAREYERFVDDLRAVAGYVPAVRKAA